MILALFEHSYTENSNALLAKRRASTRLALASSFVLACSTDPNAGQVASSGSESSIGSSGITKTQFLALLQATDEGRKKRKRTSKIREFVFTHLDQNNSGTIEFMEFEKMMLLCRCCDKLSCDGLLAHKSTIARANMLKTDAETKLTDELFNEQRHLLEETVACHERMLTNTHANIDSYLNHLNQSFKIFGCFETRQLDNIANFVDILHFWAMALRASAWVSLGFNLVYCFESMIRIYSMHSLATFCNDPRGREYALQNKVTLGATVVGMFGATLFILEECGLGTNQGRLWEAFQMAPLLRIFATNAQFRHVSICFYTGLEKIRPFVFLFCIVFYTFSMLAYYAFKDLDLNKSRDFSEQLNFSTFGDSCLAMFQATSLNLTCSD